MSNARILLFDSGMGGLTVARSVRHELPFAHLVYSADNAAFPYGAWEEQALVERILLVMGTLIERVEPDIVVIACNTATAYGLEDIRAAVKAWNLPVIVVGAGVLGAAFGAISSGALAK
jgi:glutamate racemase